MRRSRRRRRKGSDNLSRWTSSDFIAALDVERFEETAPVRHALKGVGYTIVVADDVEFPLVPKQICFFIRVFNFVGAVRFRIRMIWHGADGNQRVGRFDSGIFELPAFENANDIYVIWKDPSFPMPGLYEFQLTDKNDPRRILRREYLEVRRS